MNLLLPAIIASICIYSLHARPSKLEDGLAVLERELMEFPARGEFAAPPEPPTLNLVARGDFAAQKKEMLAKEFMENPPNPEPPIPDKREDVVVNKLDRIKNWVEMTINGTTRKIPSYESTVRIPSEEILSKFGTKFEKGAMENILAENLNFLDEISDRLTGGDIMMPEETEKRNAVVNSNLLWPNAEIPYMIDPSFDSNSRARILEGIEEFHTHTCIQFVEATTQANYLDIVPRTGCWSWVGRQGGRQEVSLGVGCTNTRGTIMHELMHAAGFWHEQSRTDRDQYVQIFLENVEPGQEPNFDSYDASEIDPLGTNYDYSSIMHYPRDAFSRNGLDTIVPTNPATAVIGNRVDFSATDIEKLNLLYNDLCEGGGGEEACEDSSEYALYCGGWANAGYCDVNSIYYPFMSDHCPLTCQICTVPVCVDVDTSGNCPGWQSLGYCSSSSIYYPFMSENCKSTCGLC